MTVPTYLVATRDRVNALLSSLVSPPAVLAAADATALTRIAAACDYAVTNGGKRIRAVLVYAGCEAVHGSQPVSGLDEVACAIELIHAYSLVHDDLPAMDDDDMRRGQPSCHRAFDEATAILAGDGLQARAFELLATAEGFSAGQRVRLIQVLAKASGVEGMVGGQAIDIGATDSDLTLEQLQVMHRLKTGALISAALALGGIAAGATEQQLAALASYGRHIGLAFQVVDDILDVEGDSGTLGKTAGKDGQANKPTYVKLLGLEGARQEAARLLASALQALDGFGESADHLRELARYIVARDC